MAVGSKIKTRKKSTKGLAKKKYGSIPILSNTKKPEKMSVEEWQSALRRQIAERTEFVIRNLSGGKAYSDYGVYNPVTNNTYKVALRSADHSLNYCSCYDFKTNQLGTCKHIEAVKLFINKKPALRKILMEPYQPAYSSMYIEYRGERKVMIRLGTDHEMQFRKLFKPYLHPDSSLNKNGYEAIDKIIQQAFKIDSSFRCYEDALNHIIDEREKNQRWEFLQPFIKKNKLPLLKSLKVKLFPYQVKGILFCASAGRSILADDMGLGKTVQAIAVGQLMHEYLHVQKVLIICPTSLKYQWQSEIRKFTTSKAAVIEGNFISRRQYYQDTEGLFKIVSYNMAVNDIDLINDYQPDLIILDEAQRIKNWQTRVSRTLKKLKSKYTLVLTGTPIENKLQELYSLVQFVNPLLLGSLYNFISAYEQKDETGKVVGYRNLNEIKKKLENILLRRTRKEVLQQLPRRMDKILFVDITDEQKVIHSDYQNLVNTLVNRWKKTGFLSEQDRQRLMIHLNQMRMVCNSTYILDQQTNYQTKLDELFNILEDVFQSGDEKVVIFSQWERFTRLIANEFDRLKIGYANLHGGIPGNKRKELFERFNNDTECRVFLSTDAGGVGLNLQAGSCLINMDLPWNPAVLEQRIARIYRHGQTKPVNIINLVAQHTIEHGMIGKLKFKTALFEGVLDNGESNIFLGDSKFNLFMQGVEELIKNESTFAEVDQSGISPEKVEEIITANEIVLTEALINDDDVKTSPEVSHSKQLPTTEQDDFIKTTSVFISQFSKILSDDNATENLVNQLTRRDELTGQTYLQIPVADKGVVKQMMGIIAGLFKGNV